MKIKVLSILVLLTLASSLLNTSSKFSSPFSRRSQPFKSSLQYLDSDLSLKLPEEFSWEGNGISPVVDEGKCNSSWAHSAASALADRYKIFYKSEKVVELSAQFMIDCDTIDNSCNGGYTQTAWDFLVREGTVNLDCVPLTSDKTGLNAECAKTCKDKSALVRTQAKQVFFYMSREDAKAGIIAEGPITSTMTVYSDFGDYKNGVYKHTSGVKQGERSVKIVGWSDKKHAWRVQNSKGSSWGEQGFFWIGYGECDIDMRMHAGSFIEPKH